MGNNSPKILLISFLVGELILVLTHQDLLIGLENMATKDNQNLQIVIISLTILVFVLGGLAIWLNGKKNTAQARAKDSTNKQREAERSEQLIQAQANNYKIWMGFNEADSDDTLQELFAKDMERFGQNFEEQSKRYRNLLENFFDENEKLSNDESIAKGQVKELKGRLLALEKEKDAQIAIHLKKEQEAIAEKESLKNQFESRRRAMIQENNKIAQQVSEQANRIDELIAASDTKEKQLNQEISKLKRDILIMKGLIPDADPYALPADGFIRFVDQRERKVWVNLGEVDRLRPHVTFSVFSGDSSDLAAAETKGSIEVTRILADHLAEALITSDVPTRPIAVGDKLVSQVWNRGRQVRFAFAGLIDLNNDGRDDSDQLKRIISINDGKVDAYPNGRGGLEGRISAETRYLVLGKYPEGARNDEEFARKSWDKLTGDADTLGVETIALDKFLRLLGWNADGRTVKLGPGARPEDFPPTQSETVGPQNTNSQRSKFRPRQPRAAY